MGNRSILSWEKRFLYPVLHLFAKAGGLNHTFRERVHERVVKPHANDSFSSYLQATDPTSGLLAQALVSQNEIDKMRQMHDAAFGRDCARNICYTWFAGRLELCRAAWRAILAWKM